MYIFSASGQADIAIIYHFSTKTKPESITKYFIPFLSTIITDASAQIVNGDIRLTIANYAKRPRNQVCPNGVKQFTNYSLRLKCKNSDKNIHHLLSL